MILHVVVSSKETFPFSFVCLWLFCLKLVAHVVLFLSSLICCSVSLFLFQNCTLDYHSFEGREHDNLYFCFFLTQICWLFEVFHDSILILGSFCYISVQNIFGLLIRSALNLFIGLGWLAILMIRILSIHKHGMSFCFFVFSVSFNNFLPFLV